MRIKWRRRIVWSLQRTRFIVWGLPGVAVYYGLLYLCIEKVHIQETYSFIFARICNSFLNFFIQKFFVFKKNQKKGTHVELSWHLFFSFLFIVGNALIANKLIDEFDIHYLVVPVVLVIPNTIIAYYFADTVVFKRT